ncbi:hypothetical protein AB0O77_23665 [Streptomyces albidoflavus]|uniref:hypothetical protein n=1 Tax=Streptomyces albidoflavus TaxID=1886 RepID=UPI0034276232
MAAPDLPRWVWGLVLALQKYEEEHDKDDPCLGKALAAVPPDVREQAAAVTALSARITTMLSNMQDAARYCTLIPQTGEQAGAEMIGRPLLAVAETGERFSGVITAAEETESGWQYTLQQHPVEAPELHA